MPRLRYRKDWEFNDDLTDNTEQQSTEVDGTESSDEETTQDSASGQSWLSNAAIIASFPDAKLRSALAYHRTMSRLFEQELHTRGLTGRGPVAVYRDGMFGAAREMRSASRSRRAAQHKTNKQREAAALTPDQMLQALQMLSALKKGGK